MTRTVVLDASAATHILLASEQAPRLVEILAEALLVITTDLFFPEMGNSLWKYVRAGTLTLEEALVRIEEAKGLVDSVTPGIELISEAVSTAARVNHSVYDMQYLILARRHGATLVTMDKALARQAADLKVEVSCPLLP